MLGDLGLSQMMYHGPLKYLSVGWKTKLDLACAIVMKSYSQDGPIRPLWTKSKQHFKFWVMVTSSCLQV